MRLWKSGAFIALGGSLVLSLSSCGNAPTAAANQTETAGKTVTASDAVAALEKAGIKVIDVHVFTEQDDSNRLLGRPGQYTSKISFFDARHPRSADGGDEGENTIEVFATAEDARRRYDYVDGITKNLPMLMQYQVLKGRLLARFDKVLLPSEVKQYEAALPALD